MWSSILANACVKKCNVIGNILGNALETCSHNYKLTIDCLIHIHMHVNSWLQKFYNTKKYALIEIIQIVIIAFVITCNL